MNAAYRGTLMARSKLNQALRKFDTEYDTSHEEAALRSRGAFLRAFPLRNLTKLKLDNYVIGRRRPTFCTHIEVGTKPWAGVYCFQIRNILRENKARS